MEMIDPSLSALMFATSSTGPASVNAPTHQGNPRTQPPSHSTNTATGSAITTNNTGALGNPVNGNGDDHLQHQHHHHHHAGASASAIVGMNGSQPNGQPNSTTTSTSNTTTTTTTSAGGNGYPHLHTHTIGPSGVPGVTGFVSVHHGGYLPATLPPPPSTMGTKPIIKNESQSQSQSQSLSQQPYASTSSNANGPSAQGGSSNTNSAAAAAAAMAVVATTNGTRTSCPPPSGKIRNQYLLRKTVREALADCGNDAALRAAVLACVECPEYTRGESVPSSLLTALTDIVGVRSQTRCKFPGCGKMNVRTDRAKEHARMHIGNHPWRCTRIQADGTTGCGATFLRKHDRNRHDNGADLLTCEACGAHIQGKGREYNLQRHRMNYCPVTKNQRLNETNTDGVPNAASQMVGVEGGQPGTQEYPMVPVDPSQHHAGVVGSQGHQSDHQDLHGHDAYGRYTMTGADDNEGEADGDADGEFEA